MKKLFAALLIVALSTQVALAIDPPFLTAPTGVSQPAVQFSWNAVAGATWYRVWVSPDTASGTGVVDSWVENNTFLHLTLIEALAAGDYTCWLQAWGPAEGYSAWSGGFRFSVGSLKEMVIPPASFIGSIDGYDYSVQSTGLNPGTGGQYWYAPLILPIGAELESIDFYAFNNAALPASGGPSLTLYRREVSTGNGGPTDNINLQASTAQGRISGSDISISQPVITSGFAYSIQVHLKNASTDLRGVRVFYWDN